MLDTLHSALGLVCFTLFAWLLGENRRAARVKVAAAGMALQIGLAALILKVPLVRAGFGALNAAVLAVQNATEAGTSLVFGYLGGGSLPFAPQPGASPYIFAFRALPLIVVISALTSLLTHFRILPFFVRQFSRVLERTLGIGGAVGLGTAANVFVGMVEGPLFVRPFLAKLTRSELFVLMVAGMATIAGTVLVLYAQLISPVLADAAGHLLTASVISAPAAVTIALLMVPETEATLTGGAAPAPETKSVMDAVTAGTTAGLQILLTVTAMLIVLVALVHLVNAGLGVLPAVAGAPLSLERVLGWLMAPVTWLMGIPWREAPVAGALMGTKTVLNEFLAYLQMSQLPPEALSPRSRLIMAYALCGFANFGSLGIMLGGLSAMVPERRAEIARLGAKSVVGGTLATLSTGAVVGLLGG
ncbi:MAG: NupC/NupG family nucleoside CNT transporter [Myxococcales bacterium]|nr:NupC/NupG family nucleoside CNT transporter [Myxococcales bacterium]